MSKYENSSTLFAFTTFFILISLHPYQSSQQAIISKSSIVQATCIYNYTSSNIYSCELFVSMPVNSTLDVLEITGTHLANHTDDDVESVSHGSNIGAYFNGEVLRKFMNLKRIGLFGENLTQINPNAFDVCPKLETLVISYGRLTSFPQGMLKNCQNLKYFESMATKIETFPEDFFGDTKNLETFYAAVNQLKSIPEKLLQNMSNLKVFRVGFNKLTELSSNLFINSPNLEEFSAYNNEFRHQNDIAFALNGRTNLRILWLDENKFTNFDFRFFAQFQKLQYLSIGNRWDTKLTNIHWQSLPASLTDLKVYGPDADIPENAFERTTNLRTLTLYGNSITNFQKDTFKPLTSLVFLYLYDTGLKTLHPEQFTSQGNLSTLLIRNSQLEELPAGIFVPLVNIGNVNQYNSIQISHSKLRRLNANSFGQHPYLRNIDFTGNQINEIERGIFSKFHPNMVLVGLYGNVCINEYLTGEDLDNHEKLEVCFKNWEEIDPNETTVAPSTTPGGSGKNFRSFEVIAIIFVGIFKILITKFSF